MEIKKIGIESDDHVRFCEIIERLRAENAARFRIAIGIARERIPLMPSCARKLLRDFLQLRGKRWRGHGLGKKSDARSTARGLCAEREIETLEENAPGADGTLVCQGFGSIRIIKVEQISLRPNRGGPETARMITVSFDFRRSSLVALNDDSLAITAKARRAREVKRFSGNNIFGLLNVGNDFLNRLFGARTDSSERDGSAHEAQKITPMQFVSPLRSATRKFAMQTFEKIRRLCQFVQATPKSAMRNCGRLVAEFGILLAGRPGTVHRWQTEQLVRRPVVSIWYCLTSWSPLLF